MGLDRNGGAVRTDRQTVASYATLAVQLRQTGRHLYGPDCPCLLCADYRACVGLPPLLGRRPAAGGEDGR